MYLFFPKAGSKYECNEWNKVVCNKTYYKSILTGRTAIACMLFSPLLEIPIPQCRRNPHFSYAQDTMAMIQQVQAQA